MKSLITAAILSTSLIASSAFASDSRFTKDEAINNCASLNSLKFLATNPDIPNSKGNITGVNENNINFTSSSSVIKPENKTHPDFDWRSVGTNNYGHRSGDKITCFYSYTGFTGVSVALIMVSK
jgi:hypothetical protein